MLGHDVALLVLVGFNVEQLHRLTAESEQLPFPSKGNFSRKGFRFWIVALNALVEVELPEHGSSCFGTR